MKAWIFISLFFIACSAHKQPEALIMHDEVSSIIKAFSKKEVGSFKAFLKDVNNQSSDPNVKRTIDLYLSGLSLDDVGQTNLYRLTGVYARLKYKDEVLTILEKMVNIPTDKKEGQAQFENPNIIRFGEQIETLAKAFKLDYRNVDNRIFEVILPGKMEESFGIYTHGDVVPADPKKWILEDGTQLDPYKMQIIGDRIYGRGTEDDKCSIAASMLAMRLMKEINFIPKRTIRLVIETTEETSSDGIKYYKEKYPLPDYNIVLDNSYPIVVAEKGYGLITTSFKTHKKNTRANEIISVTGGLASNQIPSLSIAKIKSKRINQLYAHAKKEIEPFIKKHGSDFSIDLEKQGSTLRITLKGVSAHSSEPETSVNPVPRMFLYLDELIKNKTFTENHFTEATRYVVDKLGTGFLAEKFTNVAYSDEFMGPLTAALTMVELKKDRLDLVVNLRNPKGKTPEQLKKDIETDLNAYLASSKLNFTHSVVTTNFMFRSPKGAWINTLLNVYEGHTGNEGKPISSAGGTTAKYLPNAVSFGPSHPGEKYRGHNANEFKTIPNLYLDIEMFTEMLLRIGTLEKMGE